jgi:hypothetical protein
MFYTVSLDISFDAIDEVEATDVLALIMERIEDISGVEVMNPDEEPVPQTD